MRANEVTTASFFWAGGGPDGSHAFLFISVNLSRYFSAVEKWRGWEKNLFDDLGLSDEVQALENRVSRLFAINP